MNADRSAFLPLFWLVRPFLSVAAVKDLAAARSNVAFAHVSSP
jgi:hypothetical protein